MRLHPTVCLHDVGRISRGGENLRNELIRIQRNRRNQLVELIRREWSRDIRRGIVRCRCLHSAPRLHGGEGKKAADEER